MTQLNRWVIVFVLGLVASAQTHAELLIDLGGRRRLGLELNHLTKEVVVRELDLPVLFGEPDELQVRSYRIPDEVILRTLIIHQTTATKLERLSVQARPYDEAMATVVCDPGVTMSRVCQSTYQNAVRAAAPYAHYNEQRAVVRRFYNRLLALLGGRDLEVGSEEALKFLTDVDLGELAP